MLESLRMAGWEAAANIPFRIKVQNKGYTLLEIKELFWRKGNYRFFSSHVRKSKNGWVGGCCQYTI